MVSALSAGSCLVALGPPVALLGTVAFHRAHMGLVATAAAFAWLVGCAAPSVLWVILPSSAGAAAHLMIGVLGQEGMRAAFVKGCFAMEKTVARLANRKDTEHLPINDAALAIAGGAGWSLMHSLVTFGTVLTLASDEGGGESGALEGVTILDSCRSLPLVLLAAVTAAFVCVMDVALMCVAFAAERRLAQRASIAPPGARATSGRLAACTWGGLLWLTVVGLHSAAALLTLLHRAGSGGGCGVSLPCLAAVTAASCAAAAAYRPSTLSSYDRHSPE